MRTVGSQGCGRCMLPEAPLEYIGQTENSQFGIRIPLSVIRQIIGWCKDSEAYETGGLLIGRYAEGRRMAVVTEALPAPDDSKAGPNGLSAASRP